MSEKSRKFASLNATWCSFDYGSGPGIMFTAIADDGTAWTTTSYGEDSWLQLPALPAGAEPQSFAAPVPASKLDTMTNRALRAVATQYGVEIAGYDAAACYRCGFWKAPNGGACAKCADDLAKENG